jgi:hypothetical protein
MKGSLHTDELMAEVVSRETGLRTERRITHAFVMDVPTYHKPLIVTDAAINIAPDLDTKRDICQNAIDLAHVLGIALPKVAIICAVESINSRMICTTDAASLCKMADRGQITGAILDGPLALDNAISKEAARIKKIDSVVAGDPDIVVVPDLAAGNILAKQLTFMSNADGAGIVLGARVPIILTSRADNRRTKLASCAVACLMASGSLGAGPDKDRRADMEKVILVLNAGSSSLKFSLFALPAAGEMRAVAVGQVEGLGTAPRLKVKDGAGERIADEQLGHQRGGSHAQACSGSPDCCVRASRAACWRVSVTAWCMAAPITRRRYSSRRRRWKSSTLRTAGAAASAAQPRGDPRRAGGAARAAAGGLLRHRFPPDAGNGREFYGLPYEYYERGIRRYGFHGLSYEYIAATLPAVAPKSRAGGWWSPTSAAAPACARSTTAAASAVRWASPRSTD